MAALLGKQGFYFFITHSFEPPYNGIYYVFGRIGVSAADGNNDAIKFAR